MIFLQATDFDTVLNPQLKKILVTDNTALAEAVSFAITQMQNYLSGRFDVANIFGQSGTARNPVIVNYCVDLAVYRAMTLVSPQNIPTWVKQNRDSAIEGQKMEATNYLMPDLPIIPGTKNTGTMRFGGNKAVSKRW